MIRKAALRMIGFYTFIILLFISGTFLGNKTVSVLAESRPVLRKHRIIIDPGHGGEDGGAISCTGRSEAQYNLEISLRLNDFLQFLGYRTTLTRATDTSIYTEGASIAAKKSSDLRERVKIANSNPNNILLSIHQNYFSEAKYSGAQVFYANNSASEVLAHELQNVFTSSINKGSTRKEKRGEGIYILEKANNTAVLIECGFLSNPQEEALLSTPAYQKQIVSVIASSLAVDLSGT